MKYVCYLRKNFHLRGFEKGKEEIVELMLIKEMGWEIYEIVIMEAGGSSPLKPRQHQSNCVIRAD